MLAVEYERKNFVLSRYFPGNLRTLYTEKFYKDLLTKFYNKGEIVYSRATRADRVFLIFEGEFSLSIQSCQNKELTIMKCCKGDLVGLESLEINTSKRLYKATLTAQSNNCVIVSANLLQISICVDSLNYLLKTKERQDCCQYEFFEKSLFEDRNKQKILGKHKSCNTNNFLSSLLEKEKNRNQLSLENSSSNTFKTFKINLSKFVDINKIKEELKGKLSIQKEEIQKQKMKVEKDVKSITPTSKGQFFITTKEIMDTQEETLEIDKGLNYNINIQSNRSQSQTLFINHMLNDIQGERWHQSNLNYLNATEKSTTNIHSLISSSQFFKDKNEKLKTGIVHLKSKYKALAHMRLETKDKLMSHEKFSLPCSDANNNSKMKRVNCSDILSNKANIDLKPLKFGSKKITKETGGVKAAINLKLCDNTFVNKFIRKCVRIQKEFEEIKQSLPLKLVK